MTDGSSAMAPGAWQHEGERRYAECQARLADHYDLAVDSRVVETETVGRMHYLDVGDPGRRPILLLHGFTAPATSWLPMAGALTDRYRLIAPDMPGEGLSAKPSYGNRNLRTFARGYLRNFLDGVGLDRPPVVAHSLGGWHAFLLAIDADRVDSLCLLGAPVGVSRDFPLLTRLLTVDGLNRLLFRAFNWGDPIENARAWFRRFSVVDDSALPRIFYECYARRQAIPGLQASVHSLLTEVGSFGRISPLADLRTEIAGIERPTSFVWGTEDYYWEPAVGRAVADRMPSATFHALGGHGHAPWLEPGDATETLVREFLEG